MASRWGLRRGTTAGLQAAEPISSKHGKNEPCPGVSGSKAPRIRRRNSEGLSNTLSSKRPRMVTPEAQVVSERNLQDTPTDRPAEPHGTNAPLVTPQGSRLVTYARGTLHLAPTAGLPQSTTTTEHILDRACAHLVKMDAKMQALVDKHYCRVFCPEGLAEECDPFKSLCSGIMAQQVSGAAASSIRKKFVSLFQEPGAQVSEEVRSFPTPPAVAARGVPFLRTAGLSERKAEYIKGLAEKFSSGELSTAMLINASDEEILEKLTAVRGLGKWSVEMFACFGLKRMDIFSTGDLGVQYVSYHPLPWQCSSLIL